MKNQINTLTFIIIISIILLLAVLYILVSNSYNQKTMQTYAIENQYTLTIQNSIVLLSYINDSNVSLSYAFLLSYFSSSENDTYCINQNTCTNITQILTNYFNSIYGNRWNLTVYFIPPISLWVVQMFIVVGNMYNWDPCSIRPPPDHYGKEWYEWDYQYFFTVTTTNLGDLTLYGAGWVNATAPFHETMSTPLWGLPALYPHLSQELAVRLGYCIPLSKIFPTYNFTEASVYCPNGEWNLFSHLTARPTNNLPNFFSGYLCIMTKDCPKTTHPNLTSDPYYYQGPPIYTTATDINRLVDFIMPAEYLEQTCQRLFNTGYIGNGRCRGDVVINVGAFYRGIVNISPECREVFIDYPWHEVIALYISYINKARKPDYVFLAADPYCGGCPIGVFNDIQNINGIIVGKDCPLVHLGGINTYAEGLYRFNITKWVINNRDPNTNQFIISAVYYDPHINPNGVAVARAYCITNSGDKKELNAYLQQRSGPDIISLGYPVPPNTNKYVYYIYLPVDVAHINGYLVAKLIVW